MGVGSGKEGFFSLCALRMVSNTVSLDCQLHITLGIWRWGDGGVSVAHQNGNSKKHLHS